MFYELVLVLVFVYVYVYMCDWFGLVWRSLMQLLANDLLMNYYVVYYGACTNSRCVCVCELAVMMSGNSANGFTSNGFNYMAWVQVNADISY